MKKGYRLKSIAKDDFQKFTGKKTIQLRGNSDCLIINSVKPSNQLQAYCIYNDMTPNKDIKVTNTCGIVQCIKKEHLLAQYSPSKENKKIIQDNSYMPNLPEMLKIPQYLLTPYLKSLKK